MMSARSQSITATRAQSILLAIVAQVHPERVWDKDVTTLIKLQQAFGLTP